MAALHLQRRWASGISWKSLPKTVPGLSWPSSLPFPLRREWNSIRRNVIKKTRERLTDFLNSYTYSSGTASRVLSPHAYPALMILSGVQQLQASHLETLNTALNSLVSKLLDNHDNRYDLLAGLYIAHKAPTALPNTLAHGWMDNDDAYWGRLQAAHYTKLYQDMDMLVGLRQFGPPPEDFWKNLARRSSSHLLALDARSPDAGSLAVGGIAALSLASRRDCTGNMRKADMSHFLDAAYQVIDAQLDLVDPQLVLSAIRNLGSLSHFPSGPILERACMHIAPLLTSSDCVHLTKHLASIKRLVDMPVLGGLIHTSLLPDDSGMPMATRLLHLLRAASRFRVLPESLVTLIKSIDKETGEANSQLAFAILKFNAKFGLTHPNWLVEWALKQAFGYENRPEFKIGVLHALFSTASDSKRVWTKAASAIQSLLPAELGIVARMQLLQVSLLMPSHHEIFSSQSWHQFKENWISQHKSQLTREPMTQRQAVVTQLIREVVERDFPDFGPVRVEESLDTSQPFDVVLHGAKLVIEMDGPHHFFVTIPHLPAMSTAEAIQTYRDMREGMPDTNAFMKKYSITGEAHSLGSRQMQGKIVEQHGYQLAVIPHFSRLLDDGTSKSDKLQIVHGALSTISQNNRHWPEKGSKKKKSRVLRIFND